MLNLKRAVPKEFVSHIEGKLKNLIDISKDQGAEDLYQHAKEARRDISEMLAKEVKDKSTGFLIRVASKVLNWSERFLGIKIPLVKQAAWFGFARKSDKGSQDYGIEMDTFQTIGKKLGGDNFVVGASVSDDAKSVVKEHPAQDGDNKKLVQDESDVDEQDRPTGGLGF